MCKENGCKTRPSYNVEGKTKALYCFQHKLAGMVNVISPICIHPGCKKIQIYNVDGETKGLYCSQHKLKGMVNVISPICIHPGCKTRPIYNMVCESKGLYCSQHKLIGMVDVKNRKCIHPECKTIPNYNMEGETKGLYCSQHKLEGMVDVISPICIHSGCKIQPIYNVEGETKGLYCSQHKLEGMVDVKTPNCIHSGCKTKPNYNVECETKALYCSQHKLEGMVNVKSRTCKNVWCFTRVQEKYDGYCLFCYINMFPDKPVSRNYKTKEYAVINFIKEKYSEFSWISDKKIQGGCSKRRPDLILDLGYQVIIVEIDENQHIDYDCSCENKRIMELSQDLGHRPIVFIRFNPDHYMDNGSNITSCWCLNTKGICIVKKAKKEEWIQRLHSLEKQIEYWTHPENKTDKTIEVIQLFYDI